MRKVQPINRKELASLAAGQGVKLPACTLEPLATYLELLIQWNGVMNLTGCRTWQEVLIRLALDSAHLASFLNRLPLPESPLTWDLGAGAGLPGIPLRLFWQRGEYHMVEARQKRALFLAYVMARLALTATHVFRGPAQKFFPGQPRAADCIVSRAFLPWMELLDLTRPQLAPRGLLVILASGPGPDRLPDPWRLHDAQIYQAAGRERWFWALSLHEEGRG